MALSDVHVTQGRLEAAQSLLRRHLETHAAAAVGGDVSVRVALHCRLGSVLATSKALADALGQFQEALGLAPASEDARRGMNRVERLMKGQDPDDDGDEDDDEEEEEGDEDEESDFLG